MTGSFCAPYTLLGTACVDMPMMSGCKRYLTLCGGKAGAQGPCAVSGALPVPGWPMTMDLTKTIKALCKTNKCTKCTSVRSGLFIHPSARARCQAAA